MAVVLVVIGLVILTVFPALNALRAGSQRSATQSNLQSLMLATAAYVQANGCVPCPTPASIASLGTAFGIVGSKLNGTATSCGTCAVPEGLPPYISLGLPASTAHDGWGHWITMRVDPALTANFNYNVAQPSIIPANVVPPTTPAACTCTFSSSKCIASTGCTCAAPTGTTCPQPFNISSQGICATNLSAANRVTVLTPFGSSQQAAVIFVSHGANGYGSFKASQQGIPGPSGINNSRISFPSTFATTCKINNAVGYAVCNADGDTQFVNAPTVVSSTDPYDDMLAYADRNMLVSMLGNGACQTVW